MEIERNVYKVGYFSWRHPLHNIRQFFKNIKYGWQRAIKGYCDRDLWNLSDYYEEVLIHSIDAFRVKRHGYPGTITNEEWEQILSEIVQHLKEGRRESHINLWDGVIDETLEKGEDITDEIMDHYKREYERLTKIEDDERLKGFKLLNKYWNELWD